MPESRERHFQKVRNTSYNLDVNYAVHWACCEGNRTDHEAQVEAQVLVRFQI